MDEPSREIEYKGVVYRRPPSSPYYFPPRDSGREALHREIYRDSARRIPPGWHVHHQDLNPYNNEPWNLQALSKGEHLRLHRRQEHLDRVISHLPEVKDGRTWVPSE
jgi:hypothetical protein